MPIIMAAMFFVWSASYFWGAIGASWLNGLSAFVWLIVALFSFVVIGSSRRNMKPPILLALGFGMGVPRIIVGSSGGHLWPKVGQ